MAYSKRRSREEWADLIQQQRQSKQSIKTYCIERKINRHTFQYWRSKLNKASFKPESTGFVALQPKLDTNERIIFRKADWELDLPGNYAAEHLVELIKALGC